MANKKRIDLVLDRITAENLHMGSWGKATVAAGGVPATCGTTMCFAGHAAVAAGKTLVWEPQYDERYNPETGEWEEYIDSFVAEETTDGDNIETFAEGWLDLTESQAGRIFYATGIGSDVSLLRDHVDTVISGDSAERSAYERFAR